MSWRDEARERVKEKTSGSSYKLADGDNSFRILQNKKGPTFSTFAEGRVHYGVGTDEAMCGCGKDIYGKGDCWLCDAAVPGLEKSPDPNKQAMAERIGPKEIFIVQVSPIDKDTGKFLKPKPWWVSTGRGTPGYSNAARPTLAVQIMDRLSKGKKSYDDPVKGYNMNIMRHGTGKGKATQYGSFESDESPSVVPKEILAALQPLEEFLPKYNIEDQKACYYGKPRPDRNQSAPVSASAETEIDEETQAEVDAGGFDPEFNPDADVSPDETEPAYDPEVVEEEEVPATDETEYNPEFETEVPPEDEFEPEPEPEPAPPPRRAPAPAARPQPKPAARTTAPAAPARRPPAPPTPVRRTVAGLAPKGKAPAPPAKRR